MGNVGLLVNESHARETNTRSSHILAYVLDMTSWPLLSTCVAPDVPFVEEHWVYLAEGAANVVLRYVGPASSPFVSEGGAKQVALRIPKVQFKQPQCSLLPNDVYIDTVLTKLLGTDSLPRLCRIPSNKNVLRFLEGMSAKCEPMRPPDRRKSSAMNLQPTCIWATQDLSGTGFQKPQLIVEIKVRGSMHLQEPKCGYLHQGPTAHPHKHQHSRYRMQRVHKATKGSAKQGYGTFVTSPIVTQAEFNSFYDPLDLYSGNPERIQCAVRALCEDWARNRANNLHIWCRGKRLVLPEVCADL